MSDELIKRALLAYCRSHVPSYDYRRDLTCDETGCGICNAGSVEEAAENWYRQWKEPDGMYPGVAMPFDPQDRDEMLALVEENDG